MTSFSQVFRYYAQAKCFYIEGIKAKDTNSTIQAFEKAREQYERFHSAQHELSQELCSDGTAEIVDVCENLASLYLQKQAIQVIQGLDNGTGMIFIQKVIQNGQICIQFQPDKHLGYYYLAEGFMIAGRHMDALENYRKCYQLLGSGKSWNIEMGRECFLNILALGIMYDSFKELPDVHESDKNAMCSALFGHLVNSDISLIMLSTKCIHYIMLETGMPGSGLATRLPFDASFIKVLELWKRIHLTPALIDALVKKGMTITSAEISDVVDRLDNGQPYADLLVSLCTNCQTAVDYKYFYSEALRQHKPMLAVALIHCGHKVDPKGVLSKIKYCQLRSDYAASLGRLCKPSQRSKLLTDMLNSGNKELIHAVMTSGSLSPDEVHINKIAPKVLANLGTELLNKLFKKLPPRLHLRRGYFKRMCDTRCSEEVKADFLSLLLEHNASNLVDEEAVVSIADLQKVDKTRVTKIASLCPKDLRTKVLKRLLDARNNKAVIIVFLESGPIKEKLNPKTYIPSHCFTNPDWEILELLIKKLPPCGPRKERYFEAIKACTPSDEVKAQLFCLLLKNKAEVRFLRPGEPTLAVHEATDLALKTGNMELLEIVCSRVDCPPLGCDNFGQTPLHLTMKHKNDTHSVRVCQILNRHPLIVNPLKKDKSGKLAADYAENSEDDRLKFLPQIEEHLDTTNALSDSVEHKEANEKTKAPSVEFRVSSFPAKEPNETLSTLPHSSVSRTQKDDSTVSKQRSLKVNEATSSKQRRPKKESENSDQVMAADTSERLSSQTNPKRSNWTDLLKRVLEKDDYFIPEPDLPRLESEQKNKQVQVFDIEKDEDEDDTFAYQNQEDDKEWEVECTKDVLAFLKDKRYPSWLRKRAMTKIERLGYDWSFSKHRKKYRPINGLYKVRLTEPARIIFGTLPQYSASRTERANAGRKANSPKQIVYCEVIRVWSIVLDHEKVNDTVRDIRKLMEQCKKAMVPLKLQPRDKDSMEPREFLAQTSDDIMDTSDEEHCYVPVASTNENQYNIMHFYSVSRDFINSILNGEDARRDFPFKEWPKEHDIINMRQGESILLLGRSGTGKTTCCLFRLWNEFHIYWKKAKNERPLPLRIPLTVKEPDLQIIEGDDELQQETFEETNADEATTCSASDNKEDFEHLHQVFITKNYVLCAHVRKKFYDMCASHHELLADHLPYEDKYANSLPTKLSQIDDHGYPLFLTSREFLILLDNSINDEKTKPFFPRDKDGNPVPGSDCDRKKLAFLELEDDNHNESDDEEDDPHEEVKTTVKRAKWQEVTSQYFSDKIWPRIGHKCEMKKDIDPLLVWMEIKSFIKGSTQAVQSSRGYLTLEEYKTLGRKMAANFAGNREMIYSLFKEYQSYVQRHRSQNLFDECDLLHSIYQRLKKRTPDLPCNWSIHRFYIDEVQDFTQAELLLGLHCCRDPNGLFLTGDTAQSIMRGVSFRFKDVRSLFHEANEDAKRCGAPQITVPTIHEVAINFRSHSGILKLAASVIHLLKELFPSSFDKHLPVDCGLYPGPQPVLLVSCDINDLVYLFQKDQEEQHFIEFGANQVIIVQTEAAKEKLPEVLSGIIPLTVFEAKGLEFNDVLLYNFFHDSNIEKEWKVVASPDYALDTDHDAASVKLEKTPHSIKFDERKHKSLNAELKYLYTAITRAKCNLWIYDENTDKRYPMSYYWNGLVKQVNVKQLNANEDTFDVHFRAIPSSKEEWRNQGDIYKERLLWDAAIKCYSKGDAHHLEEEAKACMFAQQAKRNEKSARKKQLYLQAAECFLLSDEIEHEIDNLENAAKCLCNAEQYNEAYQLFKKLRNDEKAIKCLELSHQWKEAGKKYEEVGKIKKAKRMYENAKDYSNLSRLFENEERFSEAVGVFDKVGKRFEALEKAKAFEQSGFTLKENFTSKELASKYVKMILTQKRRRNEELIKVVRYLPLELRLKYLKQTGLFKEAVDEHLKAEQHKQAVRVMSAQGKYDMAIEQAKKRGDKSVEARFIVENILSLINERKEIPVELIDSVSQCGIKELTAEAHLLHAKVTQEKTKAIFAFKVYQECMNGVGKLESYLQLLRCGQALSARTADIIETCSTVRQVTVSISSVGKRTASDDKNIKQALDFYHIRKEGKSFVVSKHINVWLKFDEQDYDGYDEDGMIKLKHAVVDKVISDHLEISLKKLLTESAAVELQNRLKRYRFHTFIRDRHYLQESYASYPLQELSSYLLTLEQILNTRALCVESLQDNPSTYLLSLLSPLVTWFLPFRKRHHQMIAQCNYTSIVLRNEAQRVISSVLITQEARPGFVSIDSLIDAWRSCCITGHLSKLYVLADSTKPYINQDRLPYYLTQHQGKVYHIFQYWLRPCEIVRKSKGMTTAARVMYAFLATIARRRSLKISVINFVDIATICTIGLIATVSLSNGSHHLLMPKMYEHIAQVFDDFNTLRGGHWLFEACFDEVTKYKNTRKLEETCVYLLFEILYLLLGFYNQHYNVLRYALSKREDGSALYCLELAVVLLANLSILCPHRSKELDDCIGRMYGELSWIMSTEKIPPGNYIVESHAQLGTADNVWKLFELSNYLMRIHNHDESLCIIVHKKFKPGRKQIVFDANQITPDFYKQLTFQPLVATAPSLPFSAGQISASAPTGAADQFSSARKSTTAAISYSAATAMHLQEQSPALPETSSDISPAYTTQQSTEEMENEVMELDEESALVMGESDDEDDQQIAGEPTTPLDIDPSLIDENFCGICGENLRKEEQPLPALDEDEEQSPQSPNEEQQPISPPLVVLQTLKVHCKSTSHEEKTCAHKRFTEIETNQYTPLKKKMEEFLSDLSSREQLKSEEESLCETSRSLLQDGEIDLEEFRSKYDWRQAANQLTSLKDKMESLCRQLDRAIEDCCQREEKMKAQIEENQDPKDEKPQDDDDENDDEELFEDFEVKKSKGGKKRRN